MHPLVTAMGTHNRMQGNQTVEVVVQSSGHALAEGVEKNSLDIDQAINDSKYVASEAKITTAVSVHVVFGKNGYTHVMVLILFVFLSQSGRVRQVYLPVSTAHDALMLNSAPLHATTQICNKYPTRVRKLDILVFILDCTGFVSR